MSAFWETFRGKKLQHAEKWAEQTGEALQIIQEAEDALKKGARCQKTGGSGGGVVICEHLPVNPMCTYAHRDNFWFGPDEFDMPGFAGKR